MPLLRSGSDTSSPTDMDTYTQSNTGEQTVTMRIPELAAVISQTVQRPSRAMKAPRYTEDWDISEYMDCFSRIADKNNWDDDEAGIELQGSLQGEPLRCALAAQTTSCEAIMEVLHEKLIPTPKQARRNLLSLKMTRFDVDKLARQCRRNVELGYGPRGLNVGHDKMEDLKIDAFTDGLRHREMVHALGIQRPETLQQAVKLAKEFIQREEQFTQRLRCVQCDDHTTEGRQLPLNQLAICNTPHQASGNE